MENLNISLGVLAFFGGALHCLVRLERGVSVR